MNRMNPAEVGRTDMDESIETVGVIGLGYVGLPLALELVASGYDVVGVDTNEERIAGLQAGESHVVDVDDGVVRSAVGSGFEPTTEYEALEAVDAVSICVPTPLRKSGQPDVSHVAAAAADLGDVIPDGVTVVLESTVYPGATEEIVGEELGSNGWAIGEDVFLAFSPERVDPGNETYGIGDIPKVIGGVTDACTEAAIAYYEPVFDEIVQVRSSREAEFAKLLENTFRSVNIGLINELAVTAAQLDVDIWEAIDAATTKPFGFMPFYPGPGLGGHCIPIDPQQLSWKARQQGMETRFIELADRINRSMPGHVVDRVSQQLNEDGVAMLDADILVLGVAYKPDVSDTRESPAYDVIDGLQRRRANVTYHDPFVPRFETDSWEVVSQPLTDELLEAQDCVVIVTDHSSIEYEWVVEHAERVFDARNVTAGVGDDEIIERL